MRITLAQGLGREWLAGNRLDLRIVLQAKGKRVHGASFRHLVNGALQGGTARRFTRRAHKDRRAGIQSHSLIAGGEGRRCIKCMTSIAAWLIKIVETARRGQGVVVEGGQGAILRSADAEALARFSPVPHRPEHLLAAQDQLNGPVHQPRRQDPEHLRPLYDALAAEAAAQIRTADEDVVGRDAEQCGQAHLCHGHALARRVQNEAVAVPLRHDRVGLNRVVILRRRLIDRIDAL